MHELAITEHVIQIATAHADQARASKITDIYLVIGGLTGFVNESIQFYFDFASRGTLAEGARLHFQRLPTRLRCRQCVREFSPADVDWHCPACGVAGGDVIAGKEFFVDSIEVVRLCDE